MNRRPVRDTDDHLVLKIAAGVVLGGLVLFGVQSCRERVAIQRANEAIAKLAEDAAKETRRAQAELAARAEAREAAEVERILDEYEARQLEPGQRCIGSDLFRRVDNGWVQVRDGSARVKCGR